MARSSSSLVPWLLLGGVAAYAWVQVKKPTPAAAASSNIPPGGPLPIPPAFNPGNMPPGAPGLPEIPLFIPPPQPGATERLNVSDRLSSTDVEKGLQTARQFINSPTVPVSQRLNNPLLDANQRAVSSPALKGLPADIYNEIQALYKSSIDPAAFEAEANKMDSLGYPGPAKELRDYAAMLRSGILSAGEGKGY